jgi:hypothetical protein
MDVSSETLKVTASHIVEVVNQMLTEVDGHGDDDDSPTWMNTRSIGRILSKLRLREERGEPPKRERYRIIKPREIVQFALAHHIVRISGETSITSRNAQMSNEQCEPSVNVGGQKAASEALGVPVSDPNLPGMSDWEEGEL